MSSEASDTTTPKIALITGGGRGLGRSTAIHLAQRGVDVILTYNANQAAADAVVAEIETLGCKALALQLDTGETSTFQAFADNVAGSLARIWDRDRFDYLVNNAGAMAVGPIAAMSEEDFDGLYRIHFKGVFFLTQKLLSLIADGGRIVNISSGLARFTAPGCAAYGSMKGAVEVFTRYLAKEVGPRGIAVNAVAPGAIETDFAGGMLRSNPEAQKYVAAATALGRTGVPDDIGPMIALLLAPENRWISGQRIEVSGGMNL